MRSCRICRIDWCRAGLPVSFILEVLETLWGLEGPFRIAPCSLWRFKSWLCTAYVADGGDVRSRGVCKDCFSSGRRASRVVRLGSVSGACPSEILPSIL